MGKKTVVKFDHGKRNGKRRSKDKEAFNADTERDLERSLKEDGLFINHVEGDGNCLFRSIAHQLWDSEKLWEKCRLDIVAYIEAHKDHFELFIEDDEPFDDYISRMKRFGEWGGNQEIYAASQLYKVDVIIYQGGTPKMVCACEQDRRTKKELLLSYHGECHYNSVSARANGFSDTSSGRSTETISEKEMMKQLTKRLENTAISKKDKREVRKMLKHRKGISPTPKKGSDEDCCCNIQANTEKSSSEILI